MLFNMQVKIVAILISAVIVFGTLPEATAKGVVVPSGNRNATQPNIPSDSYSRTKSSKGSFQGKYEKIRDLIARDNKLQAGIKKSAKRFGIAPVHIVGALVGEHTYNVDAYDHLQTYLVKAASYFKSAISFEYNDEHVLKFVERPQFAKCKSIKDSYLLWACRENVWLDKFSGKKVGGKKWPKDRFGRVFFQPLYAGQTFGLGQLNPLTALQVDDMVRSKVRRKALNATDAPNVYKAIMDPKSTLDYMAAVIKISIDSYANIAGVDISNNPGITSTLYNLGNVVERAEALKAKRVQNSKALPSENYYGWLVNDKLSELQNLVK